MNESPRTTRPIRILWTSVYLTTLALAGSATATQAYAADLVPRTDATSRANAPLAIEEAPKAKPTVSQRDLPKARPASAPTAPAASETTDHSSVPDQLLELAPKESQQTIRTMAIFAVASLIPAALLMVTAFVRINIVLILLRQALGSPQVPGNQVLTALALMLTAIVMEPIGERIYRETLVPLASRKIGVEEAITIGIRPIKSFMASQIIRTNHQDYLLSLYDEAIPPHTGRAEPEYAEDFPLRVLAPAFLLSELTTALLMGFFLYLPFLVIDLVVSAVLAAMGLFMLPPTMIAMPLKLILFVLADGWLLVSKSLLGSFATGGAAP